MAGLGLCCVDECDRGEEACSRSLTVAEEGEAIPSNRASTDGSKRGVSAFDWIDGRFDGGDSFGCEFSML